MKWSVFLPLPQGLRMTKVCQKEASLLIQVISEQVSASCPLCGQSSDAVHSRYRRQLKDVPCGGQAVCLQLTVHKFFCRNPQCPRKIFTERIPQFVKPWAQTTVRFTQSLQAIGFATSGSLGARLATRLGIATSWMTILRRMMALPVFVNDIGALPRIWGIPPASSRSESQQESKRPMERNAMWRGEFWNRDASVSF